MKIVTYEEFSNVEIRVGTVTKVEINERAHKPAYKIWVDFGPQFGMKQTSAQVTAHYKPNDLLGKQVVGCLNLGEKNIAGFLSQFLLLGFSDEQGHIVIAQPERLVPNGQKMH